MATTTAKAILDRAIAVITALAPKSNTNDRFSSMPADDLGNFVQWAEATPDGAFRRFFVRTTGKDQLPAVSNTDVEEHFVELLVVVAYPKTSRTGADGALDRDAVMDQDRFLIEGAIGLLGAANFAPPNADATYRGHAPSVDRTPPACDYLIIDQTMSYLRAMT